MSYNPITDLRLRLIYNDLSNKYADLYKSCGFVPTNEAFTYDYLKYAILITGHVDHFLETDPNLTMSIESYGTFLKEDLSELDAKYKPSVIGHSGFTLKITYIDPTGCKNYVKYIYVSFNSLEKTFIDMNISALTITEDNSQYDDYSFTCIKLGNDCNYYRVPSLLESILNVILQNGN